MILVLVFLLANMNLTAIATSLPGAMTSSSSQSSYTTAEDVVINWTEASNATSYGITIRENDVKGKIVYDREGLTGTSLVVGKLVEGKYSFCMRAYNAEGKGPISPRTSFTVAASMPDSPANATVKSLPGSMTSSSAQSSYTSAEDVVINWTAASNAASYGITIRENDAKGKIVYDKEGLTGTSLVVGRLQEGKYSFCMRAYNAEGKGPISPRKAFAVVEPAANNASTASEYGYFETNKDGVPVWSKPSMHSKKITVIGLEGDVLEVVSSTVNEAGNLWYEITGGYWIYSGNLRKHDEHKFVSGICECKAECTPQVVSNTAMRYVTKKAGVPVMKRPYSKSSLRIRTIATTGTKGTIVAQARNSENVLWYKTIEGNWIYSGDVDLFDESWLWPVPENLSVYSPYGPRGSDFHEGIDISKYADLKVLASRTGEVVGVKNTGIRIEKDCDWTLSFGCYVTLKHIVDGKVLYTQYSHLKSGSVIYYTGDKIGKEITVGDIIEQGTQIGITGNTGHTVGANGVHLHFSIGTKLYNTISALNAGKNANPNSNPINNKYIKTGDRTRYFDNGVDYIIER